MGRSLLILPHHGADRFLKAVEGQLAHGDDFSDVTDASGIGPVLRENRVDPNGMGEGFGDKLQPLVAGPSGSFFDVDGAVRCHQFIRSHARIPDDDEPSFRIQSHQVIHRKRLGQSRATIL